MEFGTSENNLTFGMSKSRKRKSFIYRWPLRALVLLLLVASVFVTVQVNSRALNERRLEARVLEAELATHTIATIDLIDAVPVDVAIEYEDAIAMLRDELEISLAAVPESSRLQTRAFAEDVLQATEDGTAAPSEVIRPLLSSLHEARIATGEQAASSERTTQISMLIATIAAVVSAIFLVLSWRHEQRLKNTLRSQAHTDLLTGLPNRRAIDLNLADAREAMISQQRHTGVLCLDLDGFKSVNDTMGHEVGDNLLQLVAERMTTASRNDESLLRLGGDEFAVLLTYGRDSGQVVDAASRYLDAFAEPFVIDGRIEHVRTSIGMACTDDPKTIDSLFDEADMAMFVAKNKGGNCVERFDESMRDTATKFATTRRALRNADFDSEFHLVFQPVVAVTSGEIAFFEALLRWDSPTLGSVSPGEFIPVAESTGEITAVGNWVLRNVIEMLAEWQADPAFADIPVSCNVSALQLHDEGFVDDILDILGELGVPPERLIIEVTESVAMDEAGSAGEALMRLRKNKLCIAIDDFGAGYANLSQLFIVPFDILKVDRAFLVELTERDVSDKESDDLAEEVLSSVAQIATSLGATLVCEGVETKEQWSVLAKSGVSHMQGWLTGRPARAEDLDPGTEQQLAA